jgi:hypothetical protein
MHVSAKIIPVQTSPVICGVGGQIKMSDAGSEFKYEIVYTF